MTARPPFPRLRRAPPRRGAALLVAMVLMTVVATLAAGMVWQQWRAVEVETAVRTRTQAMTLVPGAMDWARLILRDNIAKPKGHLELQRLLAQRLEETRLTTLLALDQNNTADAEIDAFISGYIEDAQARYNLRNLVANGKVVPAQRAVLRELCSYAGLPPQVADDLAVALTDAVNGAPPDQSVDVPLLPQQLSELSWLGLGNATIRKLEPYVVLLPQATAVNVNTASAEVLAAVLGLGRGGGDRLVRQRQQVNRDGTQGFTTVNEVQQALGLTETPSEAVLNVRTNYFIVTGTIRMGQATMVEQDLLQATQSPAKVEVIGRLRQVRVQEGEK